MADQGLRPPPFPFGAASIFVAAHFIELFRTESVVLYSGLFSLWREKHIDSAGVESTINWGRLLYPFGCSVPQRVTDQRIWEDKIVQLLWIDCILSE